MESRYDLLAGVMLQSSGMTLLPSVKKYILGWRWSFRIVTLIISSISLNFKWMHGPSQPEHQPVQRHQNSWMWEDFLLVCSLDFDYTVYCIWDEIWKVIQDRSSIQAWGYNWTDTGWEMCWHRVPVYSGNDSNVSLYVDPVLLGAQCMWASVRAICSTPREMPCHLISSKTPAAIKDLVE